MYFWNTLKQSHWHFSPEIKAVLSLKTKPSSLSPLVKLCGTFLTGSCKCGLLSSMKVNKLINFWIIGYMCLRHTCLLPLSVSQHKYSITYVIFSVSKTKYQRCVMSYSTHSADNVAIFHCFFQNVLSLSEITEKIFLVFRIEV